MPYPSRGRSSVAALSRKQAARRPRPPLPRAASSTSSKEAREAPLFRQEGVDVLSDAQAEQIV